MLKINLYNWQEHLFEIQILILSLKRLVLSMFCRVYGVMELWKQNFSTKKAKEIYATLTCPCYFK